MIYDEDRKQQEEFMNDPKKAITAVAEARLKWENEKAAKQIGLERKEKEKPGPER